MQEDSVRTVKRRRLVVVGGSEEKCFELPKRVPAVGAWLPHFILARMSIEAGKICLNVS